MDSAPSYFFLSPPRGGTGFSEPPRGGTGFSTLIFMVKILVLARLMLDRRGLVQAPNAQQDESQHPRARNDYDEEAAYSGFQSGPGDSSDAD